MKFAASALVRKRAGGFEHILWVLEASSSDEAEADAMHAALRIGTLVGVLVKPAFCGGGLTKQEEARVMITSGQELALQTLLSGRQPSAADMVDLSNLAFVLESRRATREAVNAEAAGLPPPPPIGGWWPPEGA